MNKSSSRPLGATLVALLYLALAVITLVIAARYVLFPNGNQAMILLFTRLKLPVTFINLLAAPPLIAAGAATLLFRGLWQQRLWGWAATLSLSFLGMLASLAILAFFMAFYVHATSLVGATVAAFILFTLIFLDFLKIAPRYPGSPTPSTTSQTGSNAVKMQAASLPEGLLAPPRSHPTSSPQVRYETIHSAPTVALPAAGEAAPLPLSHPLFSLIVASGPDQGKQFDVYRSDILIGRHPAMVDIRLTDPTVSARHARIRRQHNGFQLIDLESTNGSYLNGQPIQASPLHDKDVIRLGGTTLIFSPHGPQVETADAQ